MIQGQNFTNITFSFVYIIVYLIYR